MKLKSKQNRVVAACMALLLAAGALCGAPVLASSTGTMRENRQKQNKKQREIDALKDIRLQKTNAVHSKQRELNALNAKQQKVSSELQIIDDQLQKNEDKLTEVTEQIERLKKDIEKTKADIVTLSGNIDVNREKFKERLNVMNKRGEVGSLEVLLAASDINDFLSRSHMMTELAAYDSEIIEQLVHDMNALKVKEYELDGQKASLEIAEKNLQETQATLQSQQVTKTQLLSQMEEEEQFTAAELQTLKAEEVEYNEKVAARIAELKQLQAEGKKLKQKELETLKIAQKAQKKKNNPSASKPASGSSAKKPSTAGSVQTGGGFGWPAVSHIITSPYGMRYHPISGVYKMHTGVDIGAGYGTPVFATKSGTITSAGWSGSYGYCVRLSHDDGRTSSLYAHLSRFACSSGQHVSQGEVIGYVGSTGNSTGAHLHFELRINGSRVNPLSYTR